MYFIVYVTTNLVNGKIYVGKHKCSSLLDGYLGSGKLLKKGIEKYGRESFRWTVLAVFATESEANAYESEIVTEEFCLSNNTYNLCNGGHGGFEHINRSGVKKFHGRTHTSESRQIIREKSLGRLSPTKGKSLTEEHKRKISESSCGRTLPPRSEDHRRNISEALKEGYRTGKIKHAAKGGGFKEGTRRTGPLSKESCAKISEKLRASWASGNRKRNIYDWQSVQETLDTGASPKEVRLLFNITKNAYDHAVKMKYIKR